MNANQEQAMNKYPSWAPRFWHGMGPTVWWSLLSRNRFQIAPSRVHVSLGVSLINPINGMLWSLQQAIFGRRIRETKIDQAPLFILGHWRSGTTLLHELLVTNPDFACPNTYQCFAPSHFLISGRIITRYGGFLVPDKRPMDEMAAGWLLPQEDEFALMNLGVPSPYLRIAFPQTQEQYLDYLNFNSLSEQQLAEWESGFLWFLRALTIAFPGRRLVLKSPTHTGRIAFLHRLFPNAKFIHLTRDPRKLFPSTMRLWRALDEVQSLHDSYNEDQLVQYVRDCMEQMYTGYQEGRGSVPESQLMEVRYEDLVANPKETLREIYQRLDLGDFQQAEALLDDKLVGHREYRVNRHQLDPGWERQIMKYCESYASRYGYI